MKVSSLAVIAIAVIPSNTLAQGPRGLHRPPTVSRHASTVQQGIRDGQASLESARGESAHNRANAAYVEQETQLLADEVKYLRLKKRWQLEDECAQRRFPNRKRTKASHQLERPQVPERLPVTFLGPAGTTIRWPEVLRGKEFAADRAVFQKAIMLRACGRYGAGSLVYSASVAARDRMLDTLREKVREMPTRQYIAVKRFIRLLTDETLYPPHEPLVGH